MGGEGRIRRRTGSAFGGGAVEILGYARPLGGRQAPGTGALDPPCQAERIGAHRERQARGEFGVREE